MHLIAGVGGIFIKFNFLIKSNFLFASQLHYDKGFAAGAFHREWNCGAHFQLPLLRQCGPEAPQHAAVASWAGWALCCSGDGGQGSAARHSKPWCFLSKRASSNYFWFASEPCTSSQHLIAQLGAFMRGKTVIADSFSSSNFSFQDIPHLILFKGAIVRWAAVMLQTWGMGRPG